MTQNAHLWHNKKVTAANSDFQPNYVDGGDTKGYKYTIKSSPHWQQSIGAFLFGLKEMINGATTPNTPDSK